MKRTVGIGIQNFEDIILKKCFYVDKTMFIKEWWDNNDSVTLITRPRRFGKTLNMSMLNRFFSVKYAGQGEIFEGLAIWNDGEYRQLQGTYPVINVSFANVKETNYETTRQKICQVFANLYAENMFLVDSGILNENEIAYFKRMTSTMNDADATMALHQLSIFLQRYYGQNVIILLDEYDTPMQEAYVHGFWEELVSFTRSLFNATFKTNPVMERGLMTGITRVSKESIFSDLNHLNVVTTTSEQYATAFGFTEDEVFAALDEYGLSDKKQDVKRWYDGFVFGDVPDVYNPWSIINYLKKQKFLPYWVNSSANSLIEKLIRLAENDIKEKVEDLLSGMSITCVVDEEIVYSQLERNPDAIWSLMLASGYLKPAMAPDFAVQAMAELDEPEYELVLTNTEVRMMLRRMVLGWFQPVKPDYNRFVKALLADNVEEMNIYMNQVTMSVFSYFDVGNVSPERVPERFYHGFVLGLIVELDKEYIIQSNRESGFGRYDVMLEPRNKGDKAFILEFKVYNPKKEKSMEDAVQTALQQIEDKKYAQTLVDRGIAEGQIFKYGFVFDGKKVLIG